jgi:hypothetical protein
MTMAPFILFATPMTCKRKKKEPNNSNAIRIQQKWEGKEGARFETRDGWVGRLT